MVLKLAKLALLSCPVLIAAAACGGGDSTTAPPTQDTTPASITASAGGGQTLRVGTQVPVLPEVVVRNTAGQALAGVAVTFSVEGGGGSISGGSTTTDGSGVARPTTWTVGDVAGANVLRATVNSNAALSTTFTVTARWL